MFCECSKGETLLQLEPKRSVIAAGFAFNLHPEACVRYERIRLAGTDVVNYSIRF
jgi:hypothetical protein